MEFIKAMDGLPKIAKILLAIFLPIIYLIYQIIRDVAKYKDTYLPLILDIVFGLPLGIVNWILNIVYILKDGVPVDYGVLFNLGGAAPKAEEGKKDETPTLEAVEEKPEEPEEEPKAEEKPEE